MACPHLFLPTFIHQMKHFIDVFRSVAKIVTDKKFQKSRMTEQYIIDTMFKSYLYPKKDADRT